MSDLKPLTLNPPLNPVYVIDGVGLEKLKSFFNRLRESKKTTIGWDKETTPVKDFFFRRDRLWQFGNKDEQYVIDLLSFVDGDSDLLYKCQGNYGSNMTPKLKPVIDVIEPVICGNEFLKVGVNLGFEYEQSYWCFGQRPWHFFDCSIVERAIVAGAHTLKDYDYFSMEQMMARYFGVQINKELQQSFNLTDKLSQEQIEYAALDTRLPLALQQKQEIILSRDGLEETAKIENDAIGSFIDPHVHGWRIDRDKWNARTDKKREELVKVIEKMDEFFLPIVGSKEDIITDEQIEQAKLTWKSCTVVSDEELRLKSLAKKEKDLVKKSELDTQRFALENARIAKKEELKKQASDLGKKRTQLNKLVDKCEGKALINYGSPAQLFKVLKGIKGLGKLESSGDDDLVKFKHIPIIKVIRDFRELAKQISTYGDGWTTEWVTSPGNPIGDKQKEGWLHPGDGRLHPKFNQYEAETGRTSSSQPNGQNIPQDPEIRSCFVCDPPDESIRISICCEEYALPIVNQSFDLEKPAEFFCSKCGKACETKAEEYCIVTADMSGAELRIIAELANAKSWIDAFNRGEDVHSVGTELLFPEKWPAATLKSKLHPDGWTLEDCKTEVVLEIEKDGKVKKIGPCAYYAKKENGEYAKQKCDCPEHKKMRDGNKSTNFLLAYGGVAKTLSERTGIPFDEAVDLFHLHERTFPDIWAYLERSGKEAQFKKESRDMFGRRRQFPAPTWDGAKQAIVDEARSEAGSRWEKCLRKSYGKDVKWDAVQKNVIESFERHYNRKPKKDELFDLTHNPFPSSKDISSMFKGMHERIERQGKNHAIQGTNASIAKLACGCGFDSKQNKPYLFHTLPKYMARILGFIHDEFVVHCPKRYAKIVAGLIGDAFKRAAAERMCKVIMEFDYKVAEYWCK